MGTLATQLRLRRRRLPRGVALMMVIAVIAIAAVLGYVMLSTASLQNRAGSNQSKLVSADYLAESGLNIAMYYLQHPEQSPATNADGYWAGMNSNYTLPNGSPSTLIVSVTQALDTSTAPSTSVPWTYEVVSSASVGSSDDPSRRVTRTTGARIFVRSEYVMRPGAVLANNNITFVGPITANGDVYGSKNMALKNGPSGTPVVNGAGYSMTQTTGAGYLFPRDLYHGIVNSSAGTPIAPRNADVNLYKTYTVDDKPYSADILDALTSLLNGLLGLLTRQPSANNPGGVMFKEGTFTLSDNVTINGTLVVDGDLIVNGANITINPQPGFPALVVTGNLEMVHSGKSLTTNGVTYVGKQLKSSGTLIPLLNSTLTVNGGMIFGTPDGVPIAPGYNAKTILNYNAAKARAPELSSALRERKGVTIVRWGLP